MSAAYSDPGQRTPEHQLAGAVGPGTVLDFSAGSAVPRVYKATGPDGEQATDTELSKYAEAVVQGTATASAAIDVAAVRWVLICAHSKRDARCGYAGAVLADLAHQHLAKQAAAHAVIKISHIGGHAFAGNLAVYDGAGNDWFGYVTPVNMAARLDRQWAEPDTEQHWRGRM